MKVLSIDPGLAIMGYAVVEGKNGKYFRLCSGCIYTEKDTSTPARLKHLYEGISELVNTHFPRAIIMEKLFFNRNTATALKVGEARGLVLLVAGQMDLDVFEYTPLQVKQAVTGYGRASKEQVQKLVALMLNLGDSLRQDDEADALAVALCHFQHKGWRDAVERGVRR